MAEEEKTEDVDAEGIDSQEVEELTKAEVEELVKQRLEQERKEWQSRFDKLRNEKSEAEKKLEETDKSWQEKLQEQVSSVQKELENQRLEAKKSDLKSQAIKSVSSAGLELDDVEEKLLYKLIDPDAENPLEDVKAYIDREKQKREKIKMSAADEYAKGNGRKVNSGDGSKYSGMSYKDMANLPAEEFRQIPSDVVDKAIEAELKK